MKIIFLLPQLVYGRHGGFVGGYVNSVLNLMSAMQDEAELTLVAGVHEPSETGEAELMNLLARTDLRILRMKRRPSSMAYFCEFLLKARASCRQQRSSGVDLVYGHSGHPGYGLITAWGARAAAARAVHALYCPVSEEFQHRKMGRITRLMVSQAFRRVPHHVAISENVRGSVRLFTKGAVDPAVILPAIPDSFGGQPSTPRAGGGERQALVAGFVGHHKREKGFDLALGAIKAAVDRGEDVSLLALTSGAESQGTAANEVAQMIERFGLSERVKLVRGIKDIRDFYAQIDVLLIPFRGTRGPSDYPMVLLEAMSVGVPVVCTAVGAIPEVVEEGRNGFLAAAPDEESFSAALLRAIESLGECGNTIATNALSTAARFRATEVAAVTGKLLNKLKSQNTDHGR